MEKAPVQSICWNHLDFLAIYQALSMCPRLLCRLLDAVLNFLYSVSLAEMMEPWKKFI